jgi:hypothetical protein
MDLAEPRPLAEWLIAEDLGAALVFIQEII